jgi:hypothetical protein
MATPDIRSAYDLLRRAMQQQGQQQGTKSGSPTTAVPQDLYNGSNSRGGLLGRMLALQAGQGQRQPIAENAWQVPSEPKDPDFRQLMRVPSISDREAPTPIQNFYGSSPAAVQLAQFIDLFAKPPMWFPERLTPLEDLPPGSANGARAGQNFPRDLGRPETPEDYPPCTYCGEETGPGNYHRDHNIPKKQGGDGSMENLNPSCQHCNLQKGDRNPAEWYDWIKGMKAKEMKT